jgi:hypothetical protein
LVCSTRQPQNIYAEKFIGNGGGADTQGRREGGPLRISHLSKVGRNTINPHPLQAVWGSDNEGRMRDGNQNRGFKNDSR